VLSRPEVVYDPAEIAKLRSAATLLCTHLDWEAAHFEDGSTTFAELEHVYQSLYEPNVIALLTALLRHVPSNDPRITITMRAGNYRALTSDDVTIGGEALRPATASIHLRLVVLVLQQLASFLPSGSD
jgi:hypothetical protein